MSNKTISTTGLSTLHPPMALEEFRVYSMKELACLYFPKFNPVYASRTFRKLLRDDPFLYEGLLERGYRPRLRNLLPAQVSFLLEHLGTPKEFYEVQQGH